jgi:phosphomevalonate kinase
MHLLIKSSRKMEVEIDSKSDTLIKTLRRKVKIPRFCFRPAKQRKKMNERKQTWGVAGCSVSLGGGGYEIIACKAEKDCKIKGSKPGAVAEFPIPREGEG